MSLGDKLRDLRRYRGVTQNDLAGDALSRNMLSQIERGAALPSYKTIEYLSSALNVPASYFFENGESLEDIEYADALPSISAAFIEKRYAYCLQTAEKFSVRNDSYLTYILCSCNYHLAVERFSSYDLDSAEEYFNDCLKYAKNHTECRGYISKAAFYSDLVAHLKTGDPFSRSSILSYLTEEEEYSDFAAYTYILLLIENGMTDKAASIYDTLRIGNPNYRSHINARIAAAKMNYARAKELLFGIIEDRERLPYPMVYTVYEDLERYCKATEDYAGAYKCSVEKRKFEYKK